MKKILSLFIILLLAASFLISCSTSMKTGENSKAVQNQTENTQSEVKKDQDTKPAEKPTEKPAAEFKITENDTFAYVDDTGILKYRNIKDSSEQTLTDKKEVFDYDFSFRNDLAAYVVHIEKDSAEGKLYIQNMKTRDLEELNSGDTTPRRVEWSEGGRYLAADHGTSPTGFTRIYDINDKKWLDITGPEKSGIVCNDYLWSPYGNVLALTVPEEVDPFTPVGDGSSTSIAVYYLDKSDFSTILKGTSDFGFGIIRWADANYVYVEKMSYTDFEKKEYCKVNIKGGAMEDVSEAEALGLKDLAKLPEEVQNNLYNVSPDGKLILYNAYDELSGKYKVMLWDTVKQEKKEVCIGNYPKWILVD